MKLTIVWQVKLKDLVRRDKAVSLLTKYNLPINQISEILGLSEPAVFTQAFIHWTGESPSNIAKKPQDQLKTCIKFNSVIKYQ
jgi:AraC-like DNA-binding protein